MAKEYQQVPEIRALSFRQPWAELLLTGRKTIETRVWKTDFVGEFYIHASLTVERAVCERYGLDPDELATGAIIGKGRIVSRIDYHNAKEWKADNTRHLAGFLPFINAKKPQRSGMRFGYVVTEVVRYEPVPYKGLLGFFHVTPKVVSQLKKAA